MFGGSERAAFLVGDEKASFLKVQFVKKFALPEADKDKLVLKVRLLSTGRAFNPSFLVFMYIHKRIYGSFVVFSGRAGSIRAKPAGRAQARTVLIGYCLVPARIRPGLLFTCDQ